MKLLTRSKKALVLLAVSLGFSLIGGDVLASNIKRSCSANYYGTVNYFKYKHNDRDQFFGLPSGVVNVSYRELPFTAEGGCGRLVPNRCRARARDKLLACAKAHASSPDQIPEACGPNAMKTYPIQNLRSTLKEKFCGPLDSRDGIKITKLIPQPYKVGVTIGVHIRGNDDCGKKNPGTVIVDGKRYRASGNKIYLSQPVKTMELSCP